MIFRGECLKLKPYVPYNKKEVKKYLVEQKANVFTRNFCDSPDQLKKKLGLKDGGDQYIIGVSDEKGSQLILICSSIIKEQISVC